MSSRFDHHVIGWHGLVLAVTLILLAVPLLWMGQVYFAGGDDTQLYYIMPRAMMNDYLFNIVSDNALGGLGVFGQQSYQAPFFALLLLFQNILPNAINVQGLFWGVNLSFSFLGFYWLLGLWVDGRNFDERLTRVICSIAYCTSLYVTLTLWSSRLTSMYLLAVYPLVLFLFLRGVREQSLRLVVMAALIAILFSIVLVAVPWLVATVLVTLPFLIWHQREYRHTFRYIVYFIAIAIGLNAFWLVTMVYSLATPDNPFGILATPQQNEQIIRGVTYGNNVAYPLLGVPMMKWMANTDKAELSLLPTMTIFVIAIIAAGILCRKSNRLFSVYLVGTICWILAIYFYTVHVGDWGLGLFIFLNETVPGFTMFRNNYDKFSTGIAFAFAFLATLSLGMLVRSSFWQDHVKTGRLLLFVLFALVVLQAWPFLRGSQWDKPMWTTKETYNTISRFNDDFNALVAYLKQQPGDRKYLWLPLNNAGYIQIADAKLPHHYYSGPSPLRFLTNKSDYTGRFSFGPQAVGDQLFQNIIEGNLDEVSKLLRTMNIGYVIVNNDLSHDIINSYLYGRYSRGDLYRAQLGLLKPLILGEHVRDFGKRYSLYKIKPDLMLDKLHIADANKGEMSVQWRKISSSKYTITLDGLLHKSVGLVFLEPFHGDWVLITSSGYQLKAPLVRHVRMYGYANAWVLDPEALEVALPQGDYIRKSDGSLSLSLGLEFVPARWVPYGFVISGITLLLCFAYLIIGVFRKRGMA